MALQLRRTTYRRVEGWLICGVAADGRRRAIFLPHESGARATIAALRADPSAPIIWRVADEDERNG